ncbi:MAG: hypothetical protein H6Q03_1885 [Acidobacteria bacterium]|nr:hypothetical protein [Acidobacteriota bacterium]
MKTPALVAVESGPEAFATLFASARKRGLRLGWLELAPPPPLGGALEAAAAAGALRAVAVDGTRAVSVKPVRGAPVLRDLLREHFLGCVIVFVRGREGRPRLAPSPGGFRLEVGDAAARELDAEATLDELVRPRHRA